MPVGRPGFRQERVRGPRSELWRPDPSRCGATPVDGGSASRDRVLRDRRPCVGHKMYSGGAMTKGIGSTLVTFGGVQSAPIRSGRCDFCGTPIPAGRDPRNRFCGDPCAREARRGSFQVGTIDLVLSGLEDGHRTILAIAKANGLHRDTVRRALQWIPFFPVDASRETFECTRCHARASWRRIRLHVWNQHKVRAPVPTPKKLHGTPAGYQAHRWRPGPTCDPCKRAWREHVRSYQREWRARPGPPKSGKPLKHGTLYAYEIHHKEGTDPCEPCRQARLTYMRSYMPRWRAAHPDKVRDYNRRSSSRYRRPRDPKPAPLHGTIAGHSRHRKLGESPCEECRLAYNEYKREWRKQLVI